MNGLSCLECGHLWTFHNRTVGCWHGWTWTREGIADTEGCTCELAHVHISNDDLDPNPA